MLSTTDKELCPIHESTCPFFAAAKLCVERPYHINPNARLRRIASAPLVCRRMSAVLPTELRLDVVTEIYLGAGVCVMFGSYSTFLKSSPSWGSESGRTRTAVETLNGNEPPESKANSTNAAVQPFSGLVTRPSQE